MVPAIFPPLSRCPHHQHSTMKGDTEKTSAFIFPLRPMSIFEKIS